MELKKLIHLLYVPTMFCNMSCAYCYLGDLTKKKHSDQEVVGTLDKAIKDLIKNGYLPFNISFHGGEVTTLPSSLLDELFTTVSYYYKRYEKEIKDQGFRVNPLHIKTNLLNFQQHIDVLKKHQVSVSGSIDLPLRLHEKYRRSKNGDSTLKKTIENIKALAHYPYNKKISCVVTKEHLASVDEFISTILYLHYDIGLDMSRFNVMFGFDSEENKKKFGEQNFGTKMLNEKEQVEFYYAVRKGFIRTPLENAFRTEWFKEFTPEYCCSAVNCGNKFFLLQADGSVYSCPRGQSSSEYCYGNIFVDDIETIISNGWNSIERSENLLTVSDDCEKCKYIHYCNSGCTFVRHQTGLTKSYTCLLQKEIYRDDPERYPPLSDEERERYVHNFYLRNNIKKLKETYQEKKRYLTSELFFEENGLAELIGRDENLKFLYSESLFFLRVDGIEYKLRSPILKNFSDIEVLTDKSKVELGVRKDIFNLATNDPINNTLHIMLLRDTTVVYGDEQRRKQEHIFDYSLYSNSLMRSSIEKGNYFVIDISSVLVSHKQFYIKDVRNNIFFTTKSLREYHYTKQRKNAFYHIQAINLPFQNIEFYWNTEDYP